MRTPCLLYALKYDVQSDSRRFFKDLVHHYPSICNLPVVLGEGAQLLVVQGDVGRLLPQPVLPVILLPVVSARSGGRHQTAIERLRS